MARLPRRVLRCALGLLESLPITIGSTVFIILGHIIIFILAPVLAVAIERPRFFYERELTIFLKLAFFQVGAELPTEWARDRGVV